MALPRVSPFTPEQGLCRQDALRLPLRARCQSPKSSSPPCSWPASPGSPSAPARPGRRPPRRPPPALARRPVRPRRRRPVPARPRRAGTRTRLARRVQALRQGHLCHPPPPRARPEAQTYRASAQGRRRLFFAAFGTPEAVYPPWPTFFSASPSRGCAPRRRAPRWPGLPESGAPPVPSRPVEFRAGERRHDERPSPRRKARRQYGLLCWGARACWCCGCSAWRCGSAGGRTARWRRPGRRGRRPWRWAI